jgi:dihydrolipoamide dehydrogenase
MSGRRFDVAVIGTGPGGYVAAIRAAQNGLATVVVEKENLGGECLNHGCIPSKALIHAASAYAELADLAAIGVKVESAKIDWPAVVAWKDKVVKRLTTGVGALLKAHGVTVINGAARFTSSDSLEATTRDGNESIAFGKAIIATGVAAIDLPSAPFDGETVVGHRELLALKEIPPRLVVIGGGYIGLELGIVFAKVGSQVTVVELTDGLLPGTPRDAVKVVERALRRLKIKTLLNTRVVAVERVGGVARLTVENDAGERQMLEAEKVAVTVGRCAVTAGLGLEKTGVTFDKRGFIQVDAQRRTNDANIFAVGDVVGGMLLAHKASAEGLVAADAIAGKPAAFSPRAIAAVAFTDPEIAIVGLSADAARAQGLNAVESSFPFLALGRALTMNSTDGYVKWIHTPDDHLILGCEIVGREASALIGEAAVAVEKQLRLEDIVGAIHPHPTLTEALSEAAEAGLGHPIHAPKR